MSISDVAGEAVQVLQESPDAEVAPRVAVLIFQPRLSRKRIRDRCIVGWSRGAFQHWQFCQETSA